MDASFVAPVKRALSETQTELLAKSAKTGSPEQNSTFCNLECTCDEAAQDESNKCDACQRKARLERVLRKLRWVCRGLASHQEASFLFPEHWLEAVDVKHRIGSGLNHYFTSWLRSDTTQV